MNQFVAVVMDVARPRMLMLKISGGYTQATHAQVIANQATYMYTKAIIVRDAAAFVKSKLVFCVSESKTGSPGSAKSVYNMVNMQEN